MSVSDWSSYAKYIKYLQIHTPKCNYVFFLLTYYAIKQTLYACVEPTILIYISVYLIVF